MRIVINGQQAFGKAVLEALLGRGDEIAAVYCPEDVPGRDHDPLKAAALERGLAVFQPPSFKGDEVAGQLAGLNAELCVMAFVTKIVPSGFLNIPTHGSIQYHPSLLPRHRGPSSINWPIIQGETGTGLTIFWPDDGLDTGPVLLQKEVEIGPDDTLGKIYFGKLYQLGVEAMIEAVDLVEAGSAPRIEQDESRATYESWCTRDEVEIDWARPVAETYNLIRGADPQHGAWTTLNGRTVQLYDAARVPDSEISSPGKAGEITAITGDGICIDGADGRLCIKRVRAQGDGKTGAAEFAAAEGLVCGTLLGG